MITVLLLGNYVNGNLSMKFEISGKWRFASRSPVRGGTRPFGQIRLCRYPRITLRNSIRHQRMKGARFRAILARYDCRTKQIYAQGGKLRLAKKTANNSATVSCGTNGSGFLCEYTKVEMLRETEGRAFFKVADGYSFVGQEASLSKENANQFLSDVGPQDAAIIQVRYVGAPAEEISPFKGRLKQQWGELTFNGMTAQTTLNSVRDRRFSPIPAGIHTILAPDASHQDTPTTGYVAATAGMIGNDVWFPIGLNGSGVNSSRYIHVGHLSEGCVTCHELAKWTALYSYLISRRVPGSMGKYVGRLTVTK